MIKKSAAAAAFLAAFIFTAVSASAQESNISLSHESGFYDSSQFVTILRNGSDSDIYYTTDGSKPDSDSLCYDGTPILITENTTIRMSAYSEGSLVDSDKAYIKIRTASPAASIKGGEYDEAFKVKLSCSDNSAEIYYTTDGSTPTKESSKYKKAITISENTTLKFAAFSPNKSRSRIITEKYTISEAEFDNPLCQELFELVNQTRKEYGLSPLKTLDSLTEAAGTRAKEYSSTYSHWRTNGTKWNTILSEYGLSRNTRAENLAYYYTSAAGVMKCWMSDQWHRSNILNPDAEYIGIGLYNNGSCTYWCQLFIGNN